MSLKVDLISNEEKKRVLAEALDDVRLTDGRQHPDYLALKALMADLIARMEMPRSNVLGDIERALKQVERSRTGLGYDEGQLSHAAYTVMKHWPVIRQALEHYGEVTAE